MKVNDNHYLNNEAAWLKGQPTDAPLSKTEVERIQSEIDSIIGVTRGNKSILKLVWNGDPEYWIPLYSKWDSYGEPLEIRKRPIVLFKSIYDDTKTKLIRDVFVPRWLLLQRSEPETYADSWEKFSYMVSPKFGKKILFRPPVAPADGWYRKLEIGSTVAEHDGLCCGEKARKGLNCFGKYAHPHYAFDHIKRIAASRNARQLKELPFNTPDEVLIKLSEFGDNNYDSQTVRSFERERAFVLEHPETVAPVEMLIGGADKDTVSDYAKRYLDRKSENLGNYYE